MHAYVSFSMSAFALFSRGQPPARHTKVVDDDLRPLKTGHTCLSVPVCTNDTTAPKSASVGRVVVDDHVHTNNCSVCSCGSVRCKMCKHVHTGSTFISYVTQKQYWVISADSSMDCTTANVVYLISCRKCGVQYVGETSQLLRKRFGNHRNRLKNITNLYLYNHFSSDGHTLDDICIMPIEKVDGSTSNRLDREGFWCRELCTYYPYGLNDNVRGVGNVSKMRDRLVVNTLFHKNKRRYRKRTCHRRRRKYDLGNITNKLEHYLNNYKDSNFCFKVRTFILGLPKKYMCMVWNVLDNWVGHTLPSRVRVLLKDLITFREDKALGGVSFGSHGREKCKSGRGFMKIVYDNKGIEMINLPRVLSSRYVRNAIPQFLKNKEPPMVSYSYTKTISSKIFNHGNIVQNLNMDVGTEDMHCTCSDSSYCYEPAGHVITGGLTIIKDAKLRSLIEKGPTYREQNYINWKLNEKLCREAVADYKRKWSSREGVNIRAFSEWERKVMDCINNRIVSLRSKHINRRKKHVLGTKKHLDSLQLLHDKYVLVPADKAANNVIVVCKKYYLEVVTREITATTTYEPVGRDRIAIFNEHLEFMRENNITMKPELECLPSFYWLPKLHKNPYGTRFIAASYKCTTKPLSRLLATCLNTIISHFKQYCNGIYTQEQVLTASGSSTIPNRFLIHYITLITFL